MLGSMLKTRLIHHHPGGIFHAVLSWNNLRMLKMAVQQGRRQVETGGVPFLTRPTLSCQDSLFSEWGTLRISMSRERRLGKGASLGEEAVLADSGREGEIVAGVGRVRRATFSASYSHKEFEHG